MSADTNSALASFLTDHPRFMGVLFTAALLLSATGTAAAEIGKSIAGP